MVLVKPVLDCPICQLLQRQPRVLSTRDTWLAVTYTNQAAPGRCLLAPIGHKSSFSLLDPATKKIGETYCEDLQGAIVKAFRPDYIEVVQTVRLSWEAGNKIVHCYFDIRPVYGSSQPEISAEKAAMRILENLR